ncbi:ABC transporter G family member 11 [Platanthera zijinensis]|uniref:ABC transporter G family member 11 n=1 Tax=Platanthera zijinensis TaxID=2320716 RepID=A0AAP0B6E5_9ASPA
MLSYISRYLTFMTIGGIPTFVEDLKIFKRERLNWHYGTTAFAVSNSISSLPFLHLISVVFALFALIIYSSTIRVEGLTMIVTAIIPDFLMGIITGGWMILVSGFFQLPNDMPKPMWIYPSNYIAFEGLGYQGLYKNEFIGLTFPDSTVGTTGYSKWVDLLILFEMGILYRLLFWAVIRIREGLIAKKSMKQKHNSIMDISSLKTVEISA